MGQDMKAIFKMVKEKDSGNIYGIKINIMKEIGKMGNRMEKDIFFIKGKGIILFGKKEKSKINVVLIIVQLAIEFYISIRNRFYL